MARGRAFNWTEGGNRDHLSTGCTTAANPRATRVSSVVEKNPFPDSNHFSLALFSPAAFCIVHGESHRRRRRRTVILKAREVID